MRVLVTGAAGFIGSAVSERLLDHGAEVIGVDNLNAYYDPSLKEARLARLKALPGFDIVKELRPSTPYQAKFSIAWCVCSALCGPLSFDVSAPKVHALLSRTKVVVAADLTAKYPAAWPARLTITLHDGTSTTRSADFPRGNPENPVTTADLQAKFRAIVTPIHGSSVAARALAVCHSLESCAGVAEAFSHLL